MDVQTHRWSQIGSKAEAAMTHLEQLRRDLKTLDLNLPSDCVAMNEKLEAALKEAEQLNNFDI